LEHRFCGSSTSLFTIIQLFQGYLVNKIIIEEDRIMNSNLKVKKLVCENQLRDYDLVKESTSDGSTIMKLHGVFAETERDNNNSRRYHLEEMV